MATSGDFDLAYALDADASGFVAGAAQGERALSQLEAAAGRITAGLNTAGAATDRATDATRKNGDTTAAAVAKTNSLVVARANLAAAETRATAAAASLETAQRKLAAATDADADAQQRLGAAVAQAEARVASAAAGTARAQAQVERATKGASAANDEAARAANRHAFGARNLGQQFGDLATQVTLGGGFARAFSAQAGQIGFALSEMGGKLGKVGAFLTGPWGVALTVGAIVLAPMVEKLLDANKAADALADTLSKAADRSDAFGNAQSLISRAIDVATGKLKTHNVELRETIRLQAEAGLLAAQAAETKARESIEGVGKPGLLSQLGAFYADNPAAQYGGAGGTANRDRIRADNAPLRALAREVLTGDLDATQIRQRVDSMVKAGQLAGKTTEDIIELKNQLYDLPRALDNQAAAQAAIDALDGKGVDPRLVPYKRDRVKKPPKPKSTAARDEFGRDAADRIASIVEQFDNTPPVLANVNKQIRQIDDLIDDLGRKKPPNFKELIADAEKAKTLVREGLNKPFNDFVQQQRDAFEIGKLQAQGRTAEAEALGIILNLERQRGPLTKAQKDGVLATVEALQAQQRQLEINRERTARYVDALGGIKTEVEAGTQAFVRGDLGQFLKTPGKLLEAFQTLQGRNLFDKLFGDAFRQLQDQVTGTNVVEDASARMADAVDLVTTSTDTTSAALDDLARSARNASAGLSSGGRQDPAVAAATRGAAVVTSAGATAGTDAPANTTTTAPDGSQTGPDIVVQAPPRRPAITRDPTALFTQAIGKVGEKVASVFTNPDSAARIGKSIGTYAGKGLEGAATGTIVAGIGNAIGVKLNNTGAQIGGAIGNIVGGPVGGIVGSIGGGLIGNLFAKKANAGTSVIQASGDNTVNFGRDKSGATQRAATGLADSVTSALQSIAAQLGGDVGSFNTSIGTYNGKYRVSTSGQTGELSFGRNNKSKSTLTDFGDDQGAAVAFAIADAIADGAIGGVSAAVQRALKSSTNLDRAVAEALKVADLERSIASVGDRLKATFDDAAKVAADRVALAKKYGLDVAAVEKLNAEERAKLIESTLATSVGSLKQLLSDMASGNLFEGTAAERRTALLQEIDTTKAKADKGEAGAADTLADLYRQLIATTRDSYGTAGDEYGSDRGTVKSGAEAVIAAEQARIDAATGPAKETTAAVQEGNKLTSETNDLIAITNRKLENLPATLAQIVQANGGSVFGGFGLGTLARNVNLA